MVERRIWVNIAICPCLHSFLTHSKHYLFENKVWEIYIKKCICSLLKSSLSVDYVPVYIYICVVYYTTSLHHSLSFLAFHSLFFSFFSSFICLFFTFSLCLSVSVSLSLSLSLDYSLSGSFLSFFLSFFITLFLFSFTFFFLRQPFTFDLYFSFPLMIWLSFIFFITFILWCWSFFHSLGD